MMMEGLYEIDECIRKEGGCRLISFFVCVLGKNSQ